MVISLVFNQAKYVDNFFPSELTLKRGKQIISRREKIIHPSRLELELKTLCQEYILCLANVYDFHHSDSFFRRFYYDQYHQFWEKPCKPKKLIILWKLAITTNLNIFYALLKTAFPYQAKTFSVHILSDLLMRNPFWGGWLQMQLSIVFCLFVLGEGG